MSITSQTEDMLRVRYGLDRNPWPRRVVVAVVVAAYLTVAVVSGVALSRNESIEGNLLSWRADEESVSVDLELRGSHSGPITCVVRAQDARNTDIGYRAFSFESAPSSQTVELPTLFRAASVAVLGCAPSGQDLRVPPPDFPPGVANPA